MIKKAVIPVAGLGSRFLPVTKALPKEMLPLVDKPTIQYIIEECVAAGITEIVLVTGKGKTAIENHFDRAFELEHLLRQRGKMQLLDRVEKTVELADIAYVRQPEPLGLGHAVWCARSLIGDEPFAVLLGDDVVEADEPCIGQLASQHAEVEKPVLGLQPVPEDEVSRYGIVDPVWQDDRLCRIEDLVEKPPQPQAPSRYAIMGRYILPPSIFGHLETTSAGVGGELQLTDALARVVEEDGMYGYCYQGIRYDVGTPSGFLQSTVDMALRRDDTREEFVQYLVKALQREGLWPMAQSEGVSAGAEAPDNG